MSEEKKPEEKAEVVAEESDFADEAKPVSAPVEEKPVEVKEEKPQVKVDLHSQEEAPASEAAPENKTPADKKKPVEVVYTYSDGDLQGIEDSRKAFFKAYRHENIIKWIVTGSCLVFIAIGWVIPTYVSAVKTALGTNASYLTLGCVAFAVLVLGIYSMVFRKKVDAAMKTYFNAYYTHNNHFVFGDKVQNLSGGVDDKLDSAVFDASGLYKDVVKVGSRDCLNFTYKGKTIVFSDCAGQVKGQKALVTCFVGKYLSVPNTNEGAEIIIYLKGNKRALPPTTLDQYDVLEDSKTMVVYGPKDGKKILTHAVRQALAQINTDAVLVDVAISVKKGKTYIALGYEDSLMVLPMDKSFNPAPTEELKKNIQQIFDLIDAFDAVEEK
jgi:hypothetical protein